MSLKVAIPTVLGIGSWGPCTQPHRRCLPLTGSEGNATMLVPTVHESNYCSHHPHRRQSLQGVFLRLSQWWRTQPQYKLFLWWKYCFQYVCLSSFDLVYKGWSDNWRILAPSEKAFVTMINLFEPSLCFYLTYAYTKEMWFSIYKKLSLKKLEAAISDWVYHYLWQPLYFISYKREQWY